jgi:hypothetical protein
VLCRGESPVTTIRLRCVDQRRTTASAPGTRADDFDVGPTRDYVTGGDGTQPGDPAKAAAAILTALDSDRPPLRLVLGGTAMDNVRRRLGALGAELDAWEPVGRATDLDEG